MEEADVSESSAREEWRVVPDFPEYAVSSFGRVVSYKRSEPRILRPGSNEWGYLHVGLSNRAVRRTCKIHVLVARAFLGPRPEGLFIRHLDGDQRNNRADNLAYGTNSENQHDSVRHGTHHEARRTHCAKQHPWSSENTYLWRGKRKCRACARVQDARKRERRRQRRQAALQ